MSKELKNNILWAGVSVIFLLAAWQLLSWALNKPALPGPWISFQVFIQESTRGLWSHFAISSYRVLASLALSLALAVPMGMIMGREERFDRVLAPMIYVVYPVPKIVFLPVLMALLGIGDVSKIALITLTVFFQILVPIWDASRGINPAVINSVKSLGARRWDLYKHVVWPAVLPEMLTALRIASGTAIAILFFSETISSQEGLGYYLLDAWSRGIYPQMFAGIIALSLLGLIIFIALDVLERRVCPWKYS